MIPGRVSVVMPCYNAARYLNDAIQSLHAQTYDNFEVLAVNDGSTDNTGALLEHHAARDPRVRVFSQKNAGPSAARNAALRQVNGEYVCFLDADDVLLPEKIERQVRFLQEHPQVDLVYADYYTSDSQLNLTALTAVRITEDDTLEGLAMRNRFPPLAAMFRRRLMDAVGEFDESFRMAEDWDYWIRWAKVGTLAYLPGPPTVIYRAHGAQAHHDLDRMFVAGRRVLRKHFKSDPARYHGALGSWYALHAKARWNNARHFKTAVFLAFAAFHSGISRVVARFPAVGGVINAPEASRQRAPSRKEVARDKA
jgi:glycosyltransferase involved in cell wall biosynthesis